MTPINLSSVALAEKYAEEFFGLTLPIQASELKSAFRTAAKRFHTDTSGDEKTREQFIKMKAAYDFLVKLEGMEFVYGERSDSGGRLVTTDGTPLYELGLGVGTKKNGRDCERCEHKGYTEQQGYGGHCFDCDPDGYVFKEGSCTPCGGTGRFKQARSQKIVPCRVCHGRGEKFGRCLCSKCNGTKLVGGGKTYYVTCYECKGTGEIELMNPLFPKGSMVNIVRR